VEKLKERMKVRAGEQNGNEQPANFIEMYLKEIRNAEKTGSADRAKSNFTGKFCS
jgi:hypothetical protein